MLYSSRGKKQQECERAKDQRSDYSRQFTVNQVSAKGTRHYKRYRTGRWFSAPRE